MTQQLTEEPEIICCTDEQTKENRGNEIGGLERICRKISQAIFSQDHDRARFMHVKEMIRNFATWRGQTPFELFQKYRAYFCDSFVQYMLHYLYTRRKETNIDEPNAKKPYLNFLENWIHSFSSLFGLLHSEEIHMKALIDSVGNCLVPPIVICKRRYREVAKDILLKDITVITKMEVRGIIFKYWVHIFQRWVELKSIDTGMCDIDVYLYHFARTNKHEYYGKQPFSTSMSPLYFLDLNRNFCLSLYEEMHKERCSTEGIPYSFNTVIRKPIIGILLDYRQAIFRENFYPNMKRPETILKSFSVFIEYIDDEFFNRIAPNFLFVLKNSISLGEMCIPVWLKFLVKLNHEEFLKIIPQVIVLIMPLIKSASDIIAHVFSVSREAELADRSEMGMRLYRILSILFNSGFADFDRMIPTNLANNFSMETPMIIIDACITLLYSEGVELYGVILTRLLKTLESCDSKQINSGKLARALIYSLRKTHNDEFKDIIGKCFGYIGLLDLAINPSVEQVELIKKQIIFVDKRIQFYTDFVKSVVNLLNECDDDSYIEGIIHCIYSVLKELKLHPDIWPEIWKIISTEKREIEPFKDADLAIKNGENKTVDLTANSDVPAELPFVDHAENFFDWIRQWFCYSAHLLNDQSLRRIFLSLKSIEHLNLMQSVMCHYFPHLIVQALYEKNESILTLFKEECHAVFRASITGQYDWTKRAVHRIFCMLDLIEMFIVDRIQANSTPANNNPQVTQAKALLIGVHKEEWPDTNTGMSVTAASGTNCYFRALRWLEQFHGNNDTFDNNYYRTLQEVYAHLDDPDGVLGAFQVIRDKSLPNPEEFILAFKATGNYADALPLCQYSSRNEILLVKSLLRSNQPYLALSTIDHINKKEDAYGLDPTDKSSQSINNRLKEYQLEALCKLGDWDRLDNLQNIYNSTEICRSWGAQMSVIFNCLKQFNKVEFDELVKRTRATLMDSLQSITYEHSDTIAQANRHILKLRSLFEIERIKNVLFSSGDKSLSIRRMLNDWERQSEISLSFANSSEPIIVLRKELLRAIDLPNTENTQIRLCVQCSALTRRSCHLQTSWTYIAEARSLNNLAENVLVDMEESHYLFEKGEQFQAINLLMKSVKTNFPDITLDGIQSKLSKSSKTTFLASERGKCYVSLQLLLAEFCEKAGANSLEDLLNIYETLETFGEQSEDFYYRFATFYDGFCEASTNITSKMVCKLIRLYRLVLAQGSRYVNHAIPRMLTIWLDNNDKIGAQMHENLVFGVTPQKNPVVNGRRRSKTYTNGDNPNDEIRKAFDSLNKYFFFTYYSQMISRITHCDPSTYALLKHMLSELITEFPHQSLWLSLCVSRSTMVKERATRCADIFELAKKKSQKNGVDLNLPIMHYDYMAAALIRVADANVKQSQSSFHAQFPYINDFISKGIMKSTIWGRSLGRVAIPSVPPRILLPFINDAQMITADQQSFTPSDICLASSIPTINLVYRFEETYIVGVDDKFETFKSLEMPKKISLIGSDGKKYPVMCKGGDDLRKDARFMDVNKMFNSLFMRDIDAKQHQLYIRSYSVIPLKDNGGIIQWVPNLVTFGTALKPLMQEKQSPLNIEELKRCLGEQAGNIATEERISRFRAHVCPRYPLSMAEWLRRTFLDACSWYKARLAFTRTAATMSMVGFLLGLGDRHCENILLDTKTGDVVHVDFNILFYKGEYLQVPEIVPFRLTRNMIDGFGATGVEGSFRRSCETALRVMRKEKRMLGTVLQAFAHDPLLEWKAQEKRNQQARQYGNAVLHSQDMDAGNTIERINMRLHGQIVTARFHPPTPCSVPMSVEGQVAKLIEIARSDENLSRMYIGWSAFF